MVSHMSEVSKSYSFTTTTSTRPSGCQWRACSTCNHQLPPAAKSPVPSSPQWKRVKLQLIMFLTEDQHIPACLVRILLLRAGIHPNPGSQIHTCPVCQKRVFNHTRSVRCSKCLGWCHLRQKNNCSPLKSDKEYSQNFTCLICTSQPSQSLPIQQSQPTPPSQQTAPNAQPDVDKVNQPHQANQPIKTPHPTSPLPTLTKESIILKSCNSTAPGLRGKSQR